MAPGGGADAPNTDSAWDAAHCNPDSLGKPIVQQTFTREGWVQRSAAALLRGHVDGEPRTSRRSPRS